MEKVYQEEGIAEEVFGELFGSIGIAKRMQEKLGKMHGFYFKALERIGFLQRNGGFHPDLSANHIGRGRNVLFEILASLRGFYQDFREIWEQASNFHNSGVLDLANLHSSSNEVIKVVIITRKKKLFAEIADFLHELTFFLRQAMDRANHSLRSEALLNLLSQAEILNKKFFEKIKPRIFIGLSEILDIIKAISLISLEISILNWSSIFKETILAEKCNERSKEILREIEIRRKNWEEEFLKESSGENKETKEDRVVEIQKKVQRIYRKLGEYKGKVGEYWDGEEKGKLLEIERNLDEIFKKKILGWGFLLKKNEGSLIELQQEDFQIIKIYQIVSLK
jgi:hypothetical protein